jgi:hypothetical protein
VDSELFWSAWWDFPFPNFGCSKIYIAGESEDHIEKFPQGGTLSRFFLSEGEILAGLDAGTIVAYEIGPNTRLRNITSIYRGLLSTQPSPGLPRYIDFSQPTSSVYLGPGWWEPESGFRWSAKHATFRLRGPVSEHGEIVIRGFSAKQHMERGPLHLTVSVEGKTYPAHTITGEDLTFELKYPLAAELKGKASMEVAVDVERTLTIPGDKRDLGLGFWKAEVLN